MDPVLLFTHDFGAITATSSRDFTLGNVGGEWIVESAAVLPNATLAASGTNYYTITIKQGSSTIGTMDSQSTAYTAGTARAFSLTKDVNAEFGGTDAFALAATLAGSETFDGTVSIVFKKVRS